MIVEIEMYGCKCDNCNQYWSGDHIAYSDEFSMKEVIGDDDSWHTEKDEDKHYCPDCHSFDNEGNLVIKQIVNG